MHRRPELAAFLKARRGALTPGDVGLVASGHRRTAGLRREEVAHLAGVSVSWYTWLEQGRPINASADVLDALARTLRLDPVERTHLFQLASTRTRASVVMGRTAVSPMLHALIDHLDPAPAYVMDARWDLLVWNKAFSRLFPSVDELQSADRNLVWFFFGVPALRELVVDWESEARRVLSQFRAETVLIRDDDRVAAIIARLLDHDPDFAQWWPRHDVARFESHERRFDHAGAGALRFIQHQLVPADEPDLRIVVQMPAPGDDSAVRLAK